MEWKTKLKFALRKAVRVETYTLVNFVSDISLKTLANIELDKSNNLSLHCIDTVTVGHV